MDYQVYYTDRSLADLEDLLDWIAKDDPRAASRFGTALLDHVDLLGRFPRMGRAHLSRLGYREMVHGRVLVYYRIHEEARQVEVLHFRHRSRRPAAL